MNRGRRCVLAGRRTCACFFFVCGKGHLSGQRPFKCSGPGTRITRSYAQGRQRTGVRGRFAPLQGKMEVCSRSLYLSQGALGLPSPAASKQPYLIRAAHGEIVPNRCKLTGKLECKQRKAMFAQDTQTNRGRRCVHTRHPRGIMDSPKRAGASRVVAKNIGSADPRTTLRKRRYAREVPRAHLRFGHHSKNWTSPVSVW